MSERDDPFTVLGLDETTADEREAKRAYARLVKIHRPDRAPDDFRRIHAAFEAVKQILADGREDEVAEASSMPAEPEPAYPDADALFDRLDTAFAGGDIGAVRATLTDPDLVSAAHHDPVLAEICLRSVAGLAWRGEEVQSLFSEYTQGASAAVLEVLVDRIELDLRVASALRASDVELPAPLRRLFEDLAIADARRARALRRDVDVYLIEHRDEVVAVLDRIAATEPALADDLCWWCAAYSPWGTPTLSDLPKDTFQALSRQLVGAGRVDATKRRGMPYLIEAPILIILALIELVLVLTATWRYPRWGRAALARVITLVGVPAECVRAWIVANRQLVPRLRRYESRIDGDGGLRLLGHVAWLVHAQLRSHGG